MTEFVKPASSIGIQWADLKGALLVIDVKASETGINTAFGVTDAVRADVHIIDGPESGSAYLDTLVFPKALQGQLRPNIGQKVIGRLTQGAAKPGQSAPWLLAEAGQAEYQLAARALSKGFVPPAAKSDLPPF